MKFQVYSLVLVLVLLTAGCSFISGVPTENPVPDESKIDSMENTSINVSKLESHLLSKINSERTSNGLSRLEAVEYLNYTSSVQSELMADKGYASHEYPNSNYSFSEQMDRWNINCGTGYENIAYYQATNEETENLTELSNSIVTGWKLSDDHRRAMLSKEITAQGLGVYVVSSEIYVTHQMCER